MTAFLTKQQARFKDNDSFDIGADDLRGLAADIDALPVNQRRGGPFLVIYLTHAEAVADNRADNASLDQIALDRLCVGCLARVDLHPDGPGQWLTLGYDDRTTPGGLRVHLDGNFSEAAGASVPVKWYKMGSQEAVEANVPLLDPARNYLKDYQVRAIYDGVSYNFYSVNGGAHPAPADFRGDGNWGAVAPQLPPTQLTASYPLAYVQYLLATAPTSITAGVLYLLRGFWNGAPYPDVVEVQGGRAGFAALGTLVSGGTRQAITVNVADGTYSTTLGTGGGGPPGGSSELPVRHTSVVTFDASAIYDTVYSVQPGALPFSVNTSTLSGSGLAFILVYPLPDGPLLTDPLLDLAAGASFRPYTKQLYAFAWGLDNRIQVTITSFT